ncbi:MAG TPA: CHRD domain-containing protein [Gemmatimonadaceae bacterium]
MSVVRSAASIVMLASFTIGCSETAGDAARLAGPIDLPVFAQHAGGDHFHANPLKGDHEVPPNESKGNGVAQFQLSEDGTTMSYKLVVANTENVTQAHIHLAPRGVNGPVVVFLYGFNASGTSENGVLAEGEFTAANLIPRPTTPIGPFGGTMEELVAALRSGNAYVNVHTIQIPGGEIRNQIDESGD